MACRLLLVAGGTGGHIMPAITFGRWAETHRTGTETGYVCGTRVLEQEIYSSVGIVPRKMNLSGSPISSGVSLKGRIERVFSTACAFAEARKIIKEFRPDCCVLFGGYVSLPFLIMCKAMNIPAVLHEQNASAGIATKLAIKIGMPVLTGWDTCFPLARSSFTRVGVPVREFRKQERAEALQALGINSDASGRFIAIIFSGSLGSSSIRERISEIAAYPVFKDWLFLIPAVSDKTEKIADNAWILPKIWEPSPLFAAADVFVTRAGGSTLTEISVLGIPALIIPWRGAANNHQYHNAVAFLSENTGIILNLETDIGLLVQKLLELKALKDDCVQQKIQMLYDNRRDKICEGFWEAIASRF